MKAAVLRTGLETLYFSGAHILMQPFVGGVGAILTMHHVRPPHPGAFQPNRLLEVSPAFLEDVIAHVRGAGIEIISLDDMRRRMLAGEFTRRFVCLTFDDGYRDNLRYAYPILKKHGAPFALYIATSFPDRMGALWWLVLEAVIAKHDRIGLLIAGEERRFHCASVETKYEAFEAIYWWLRSLGTEEELRATINELAARYCIDVKAICADLCMTWDEIGGLAADPLVTIGAHTVDHVMLRKTPESVARSEMHMSARVIETALGVRPQHLAYPVGDATSAGPREFQLARELGFKTAVTTRPGVLFPEHRDHLTALPRISLNGEYQRLRYVSVLLSGAATALWNNFRRVDAA